MKLSEALLGAILASIALQALPSCKKETPSAQFDLKKVLTDSTKLTPANCPGCGMG